MLNLIDVGLHGEAGAVVVSCFLWEIGSWLYGVTRLCKLHGVDQQADTTAAINTEEVRQLRTLRWISDDELRPRPAHLLQVLLCHRVSLFGP